MLRIAKRGLRFELMLKNLSFRRSFDHSNIRDHRVAYLVWALAEFGVVLKRKKRVHVLSTLGVLLGRSQLGDQQLSLALRRTVRNYNLFGV